MRDFFIWILQAPAALAAVPAVRSQLWVQARVVPAELVFQKLLLLQERIPVLVVLLQLVRVAVVPPVFWFGPWPYSRTAKALLQAIRFVS